MIYNDKNDSLFKWIDLLPVLIVVLMFSVIGGCWSSVNSTYEKHNTACIEKGGELHYWKYEGYVCLSKEVIIK